jgi:hypothetical protein
MGELRRLDHPRLLELEPGRWWLRSERDLAQARPPLSDRLEWAVFGLLSTSQSIDEGVYFERVARMFSGHDTPDPELVRAILDSYRDPASSQVRRTTWRGATLSTASSSACSSNTGTASACVVTCQTRNGAARTAAGRSTTC